MSLGSYLTRDQMSVRPWSAKDHAIDRVELDSRQDADHGGQDESIDLVFAVLGDNQVRAKFSLQVGMLARFTPLL